MTMLAAAPGMQCTATSMSRRVVLAAAPKMTRDPLGLRCLKIIEETLEKRHLLGSAVCGERLRVIRHHLNNLRVCHDLKPLRGLGALSRPKM